MARGYPDFFGHSVFPSYGAVTTFNLNGVWPAFGGYLNIINIIGKGTMLGFTFMVYEDAPPEGIRVDGGLNIDAGGFVITFRADTDNEIIPVESEIFGKVFQVNYEQGHIFYSLNREIPYQGSFIFRSSAVFPANPPTWFLYGYYAPYI